jgi:hypothetical protein
MTGKKVGNWLVLRRAVTSRKWGAYWRCRCTCGMEQTVLGKTLRNGDSTQCLCCRNEHLKQIRKAV